MFALLFQLLGGKQQRLTDLHIRITMIVSPVSETLTTPCVRNSTGSMPTGQTLARPFGRSSPSRGDGIGRERVELMMRGSGVRSLIDTYNINTSVTTITPIETQPFVKYHSIVILHHHTCSLLA